MGFGLDISLLEDKLDMPFSAKTIDFLLENSLRDNREWFHEHKEEFVEYVIQPFADFVLQIQPKMKKIDIEILCDPKKLPHIYRDTRFSKNKSIFRADMWYSFGRRHGAMEIVPEFYFDISPDGYSYGCGYYQAGTARMEVIRHMIAGEDQAFLAAKKAYEQQSVFELCGEEYKKNHYPDYSEDISRWMNKRNLYLSQSSHDFDTLYRDDLAEIVARDFTNVKDFYCFLVKVENQLKEKKDFND